MEKTKGLSQPLRGFDFSSAVGDQAGVPLSRIPVGNSLGFFPGTIFILILRKDSVRPAGVATGVFCTGCGWAAGEG